MPRQHKRHIAWGLLLALGCSSPQNTKSPSKSTLLETQPSAQITRPTKSELPNWDWDFDGLRAPNDKCPLLPEDKDGWQDNDGCPDLDNDGDKVADWKDQCPNRKGPQKHAGCPTPGDMDNDGVADAEDKCPQKPERYNGLKDEDGCPDGMRTPLLTTCHPYPGTWNEYTFVRNTTKLIRQKHSIKHMQRFVRRNAPVVIVRFSKKHSTKTSSNLANLRAKKALLQMKRAGFTFKRAFISTPIKACEYGTCGTELEDVVKVKTYTPETSISQHVVQCLQRKYGYSEVSL